MDRLDRRTALKALAAAPLLASTCAPVPAFAAPVEYDSHGLQFRQRADGAALFDGGPEEPGTVYVAFREVWRVEGGRQVYRLTQEPSGSYRILPHDSDEPCTFAFHDHEGLGRPTVRLQRVEP